MSKSKYNLVKLFKKNSKKGLIRLELNKNSKFAGVIFDFVSVQILDAPTADGSNASITYNIVKVPKNKYNNLDDQVKIEFENEIKDVFADLLTQSVLAYSEKEKQEEKHE